MTKFIPKVHALSEMPKIGDELIIDGNLTKLAAIVEPDGVMGTVLMYSRTVPAGVGEKPFDIEIRGTE